jgi:hypothetical protein
MAVEDIGFLYKTKIPGYTDAADIQAALRAYHYGSYDFNTAETEPTNLLTPSIARTLYELQQSINNVDISSAIAKSVFAAKGDLISASANDTPEILNSSLAGNGKILKTNSATATGLEWTDVLPSLTITLSTASSATDGIISWDPTNKKIQVGNGTIPIDFASSNLVANTKTSSYTTVITDKDKVLEMNVDSANNLTIPLNSAVAYPIGTQINILQVGVGQTTVVPAVGVTINATPGLKLRAQWSAATIAKRAENTWVLIGDLIA